jgi:hypothetical protein
VISTSGRTPVGRENFSSVCDCTGACPGFEMRSSRRQRCRDELRMSWHELLKNLSCCMSRRLPNWETTELDFSKHLTATSGRRSIRSASPGQSEAAARGNARNRSLRASGPTVRIVRDSHSTTAGVRSGKGFIPRPHQVDLIPGRLDLRSVNANLMRRVTWPADSLQARLWERLARLTV